MQEHVNDPYVQRAQKEGWRSRAVFKLEEIDQKHRLIKPGMTIVDLGAAPGGWSQYVAGKIGKSGICVALDILPMEPLNGVQVLQSDFTEDNALQALEVALGQDIQADLVLSDMAPNISGVNAVDQARSMYLAELANEFCRSRLRNGGCFVLKLFQGVGFQELMKDLKQDFTAVRTRKPAASRPRSRELYAVCTGFSYNHA